MKTINNKTEYNSLYVVCLIVYITVLFVVCQLRLQAFHNGSAHTLPEATACSRLPQVVLWCWSAPSPH